MKTISLLLILILSSCSSMEGKVYKFNGRVTSCRHMEISECGIMLYACVDGFTYQCLNNVKTSNE